MSNKLILILERFTSNTLELLWNTSMYLTIINAILRPITQLWCYFIAIRVKWLAKFFKAATEDDKFHHGFWPKKNCRRNLPGRYGNIYKVHHPILVLEYFWVFGQASIHPSTHSDCGLRVVSLSLSFAVTSKHGPMDIRLGLEIVFVWQLNSRNSQRSLRWLF